jgi:hypothetical protein
MKLLSYYFIMQLEFMNGEYDMGNYSTCNGLFVVNIKRNALKSLILSMLSIFNETIRRNSSVSLLPMFIN